ncbi:MAG: hypothetical protein GOV01_00700 [Candidatus Altiarchaeota archaeon]|nr:hypothetical protein [Candidatus Altiarchaeota archaeon]
MMWFIGLVAVTLTLISARAHCPLCTAAAGAGVAITRMYGVDDTIVGLWLGAALVSTALWLNKSLKNYFRGQGFVASILMILSLVIPLYATGFMGGDQHKTYFMMPGGSMFGIDKLLLGIIFGGLILEGAIFASKKVKEIKGLLFPYQTIVFIVVSLTLASLVGWMII